MIRRIVIKKFMYSENGLTFDGTGSRSFNNGTVRTVRVFGVDNSSSAHADNS